MTPTGPFAPRKFIEIKGRRMAYVDEGESDPIVFQHGNPTSSYLWRKVMPACRGLGRLIACDLIGMGASDKLPNAGATSYGYAEHREFLFALWEELGVRERAVLVVQDWGSVLGLDWAMQNPGRVRGVAFLEAIVTPLSWDDLPDFAVPIFKAFRSSAGDDMILRDNVFLENLLIGAEKDNLSPADIDEYRRPFLRPGEDRRPMLSWPRQIPIDGEPPDVVRVVAGIERWLRTSDVPKLWIRGDPGAVMNGRVAALAAQFPNQTTVVVPGHHFLQESAGPAVGAAVAAFVRGLPGRS